MIDGAPVNVLDFGAKGDGITDDTDAIQNAIYAGSDIYIPEGQYVVSSTIEISAGKVVRGVSGRASGFYKTNILPTANVDHVFDISTMKFGTLKNLSIQGNNNISVGVYGEGVFNALVEDVRVENATDAGFRLTANGATYGNTFLRCMANACAVGFSIANTTGAINLTIFDACIAYDCTTAGFLEWGNSDGISQTYRSCDVERCAIGISVQSRAFIIDTCYVEHNDIGIKVSGQNLAFEQQGGTILNTFILGSYLFPGIPSKDSIGVQILDAWNITVQGGWLAYMKTGIYLGTGAVDTSINDVFYGVGLETPLDSTNSSGGVSIRQSNQYTKKRLSINSGTTTIGDDINIIAADVGNNNVTVNIPPSNWRFNDMELEAFTIMGSSNTGSLTLDAGTGNSIFGQYFNERLAGQQSIVLKNGHGAILYKVSNTAWQLRTYTSLVDVQP